MTISGWGFCLCCLLPVSSAWLWLCTCRMTRAYFELSSVELASVCYSKFISWCAICSDLSRDGRFWGNRSRRDSLWMALFALFISISIQTNSRQMFKELRYIHIHEYTPKLLFKVFLFGAHVDSIIWNIFNCVYLFKQKANRRLLLYRK